MIASSLHNILVKANPNNKVSDDTMIRAKIPSKELVNKLKVKKKQDKVYLINNFHDIAWMDPFPDEVREMASKEDPNAKKEGKSKKKEKVVMSKEDFDDGLCVGLGCNIQEDPDVLIYQEGRY